MKSPVRLVVVASLGLSLGCDEGDQASQKVNPPPAEQASASPSKESAAPPRIDPSDAKALVERWARAQNEGEFPGYRALYADKFLGIKRAGERTTKYERAGWLKDRRKMFRAPMQVEVHDIDVRSTSESAVVTFVQHWRSKTFEDVGPKQLVLVEEDEGLRIAREEMMRSELRKNGGKPRADGFYFVVGNMVRYEHGGTSNSALQSFDGKARFNVRREVTAVNLPKSVVTFDKQGRSCTANVDGAWKVVQVDPHFSQEQYWNGALSEAAPLSERQKRQEIWKMGSPFETIGIEGCADAAWAVSTSSKSSTTTLAPAETHRWVAAAVAKSFKKLSEYAQVQQRYTEWGGSGEWTDEPFVRSYAHGGRTVVVVSAKATTPAGEECGGYVPTMFALFDVVAKGAPKFLGAASDGERHVVALFDLHSDGKLEVLTESPSASELWRADAGELTLMEQFTFRQNFDCGC